MTRTSGRGALQGAQAEPRPEVEDVVLIVDDEAIIAEAVAMLVEDAGYTPVVAHDGREALALARRQPPALVITDLMMPRLDGAGLVAALRREAAAQHRPAPPVIVMTAAGRRRADDMAADAVVPKPFDMDELEGLLLRLLSSPAAAEPDGSPR